MASAPNTEAHSDFSATTEKPLAHDSRQPSPISDKHSDTSKTHNGEDIVSSEAKQPAGEEIPTEDESNHAHGVKLALIVASMCMAVFLVALDQTIIAPALGAITAEYKSVKDIVRTTPYFTITSPPSPITYTFFSPSPPCLVSLQVANNFNDRVGMAPLICSPPLLCNQCSVRSIRCST